MKSIILFTLFFLPLSMFGQETNPISVKMFKELAERVTKLESENKALKKAHEKDNKELKNSLYSVKKTANTNKETVRREQSNVTSNISNVGSKVDTLQYQMYYCLDKIKEQESNTKEFEKGVREGFANLLEGIYELQSDIETLDEEIYDILPVGSVVPYDLNVSYLSDNWVLCDGRTINDNESIYDGHTVPNLQGYFIRGKKDSENRRAKGGDDYTQAHTHSIPSHKHEVGSHTHDFTTNSVGISGYRYCTTSGYGLRCFPEQTNTTYFMAAPTSSKFKEKTKHSHSGTTGNASSGYTQSGGGGTSGSAGGHTNIPRYKAFNHIIKIK